MLTAADADLVEAAERLVRTRGDRDRHSVAAALRDRDGNITVALNVYHFTGGPCAELVALARAASEGFGVLDTIVAVADEDRGVLSPCGKCRQVLFDYHPTVTVIVPKGANGLEAVAISDLLPFGNRWSEATGSVPEP